MTDGVGPAQTLAGRLGSVARAEPDRPALVAGGRRFTYSELDRQVTRLAAGLRRLGVRPGGAVVLLLPNGWEAICCFFAVMRAGAVAVPLNPRSKAREIRLVLDDVRPALLVAAGGVPGSDLDALLGELRRTGNGLPPVAVTGPRPPEWATGLDDLLAADDPVTSDTAGPADAAAGAEPSVGGDPQQVAAIFYTTGTTGAPKGVLHTHAGLLDSVDRMAELQRAFFSGTPLARAARVARVAWRYRARLRHGVGSQAWMTPLACHGVAGFRFALQALLSGHRLILMDQFHPTGMLRLVPDERVNVLAVAPSMLEVALGVRGLDRYDLSSLLVVGLGGAPTAPELVRRARSALRCAVVVGYGATETGGGVLVTRIEDGERQLAETVGRPFPGAEVKVVDDQRRELPRGAVGELACRSPSLMAGYRGPAAATADVLDDRGWYYTGDLASIDERGFVRIVGRKRDLIIRGGCNVVPAELEAVLGEHPQIGQAAVVGVPDRLAGEAIHAFLVPAAGTAPGVAEVRQHCARRLEPGKVPDHVHVLAALPVTETGEVRKAALRELAEQRSREGRQARPTMAEVEQTVD